MTALANNPLEAFHWEPQPEAQRFVLELMNDFLSRNALAAALAKRMTAETGTRFFDWIGHITLPRGDARMKQLTEVGYVQTATEDDVRAYDQPRGIFPTIVQRDRMDVLEIAMKVESVADFFAAQQMTPQIEGEPLSDVRVAEVSRENGTMLTVIERHGSASFAEPGAAPPHAIKRLKHLEAFRTRRRDFENDEQGFAHANKLIDAAIADLGKDLTCDLFFAAEREFWERRNRAAQVQKNRQDVLGLGWANHDHHTYRASRANFMMLVETWEKLGFVCRERFYAGREAGWGAQVMEQPVCRITTFNDVDLTPEELFNDFAHEPLAEQDHLGTVGLWCGLHGDSFLQAGMHHLEAQFDFDALRDQLETEENVKVMKPFTNFTYLRQAFTEGERWKVDERRIARLLDQKLITREQADEFIKNGAIGSHLENLERNDGFKGFNQQGVSEIIAATDPRRQKFVAVNA